MSSSSDFDEKVNFVNRLEINLKVISSYIISSLTFNFFFFEEIIG